jgi:hypothetical protein
MNWKVLLIGAASVLGLVSCGSSVEPTSNAAPVARAQAFSSIPVYPRSRQVATVTTAYHGGNGQFGFFINARAKITDTWYDTVTVGFDVCGNSGCRTFTVPVYKYYGPNSWDYGSQYINCYVTDGSTSLKVYASNYSPIVSVAAGPEAEAYDSDDFGPRTPSVGNCNR